MRFRTPAGELVVEYRSVPLGDSAVGLSMVTGPFCTLGSVECDVERARELLTDRLDADRADFLLGPPKVST
jgi:hypothetical protein